MNCDNCGAAMKLVDRRDYYVCEYCHTFKFPEKDATSDDGIAIVGDQTELSCPVCHGLLSVGTAEGKRIFYCETCRGMLATNDTFADLVRIRRSKREAPDAPGQAINPDELKRQLQCPKCNRTMDVHPYYGPGHVVIDTCCNCFLVWLDHGELAIIERAPGRR